MKKLQVTINVSFIFLLGLVFAMILHNYIPKTHADEVASNFIYGCVNNSTGALKIIDAGGACDSGETPLNWNAQNSPGTGAFLSDLSGANFSRDTNNNTPINLSYRSFYGTNFANAHFEYASLQNDDLRKSNLSNASIGRTNFSYADLREATLSGAIINLGNTSFDHANISGDDFSGVIFDHSASFENTTASNTNFSNVHSELDFNAANLTNANFASASANATAGSFSGANVTEADFSNTTLHTAYFDSANCTQTNFTNASLTNTDFSAATIDHTNFTGADLTNVNFTNATLTSPTWNNTTCPDGTNSNDNSNTCDDHLNL